MPPINKNPNGDVRVLNEFLRELDKTSDTVKKLLSDVRESEINVAKLQPELASLCRELRDLTNIVHGGDKGLSLLTRLHLLEDSVKDLETQVAKLEYAKQEAEKEKIQEYRKSLQSISEVEVAKTSGSFQLKIALISGGLGAIIALITLIFQHCGG